MPATDHVRRVVLTEEPFIEHQFAHGLWQRYRWPAHWIAPPGSLVTPIVFAARCSFFIEAGHAPIRLHVSADERFELYLNGELFARGPERGDENNWFFQTYDLTDLPPGEHWLTARVWAMGEHAPIAQRTEGPAFLLAAEGAWGEKLNTGAAPWRMRRIEGVEIRDQSHIGHDGFPGKKIRVNGQFFPFGFEQDHAESDAWGESRTLHPATTRYPIERHSMRSLRPAMLPDMLRQPVRGARCVFAEKLERDADLLKRPCAVERNDLELVRSVQSLFDGEASLHVEPDVRLRAVVDLGDYYCAYPSLITTGGAHAEIDLAWAESLYLGEKGHDKGDRDQVIGKIFRGYADAFAPEGGTNRAFSTLWWQAGRYVQLTIDSPQDRLIVQSLSLEETRYPLEVKRMPPTGDEKLKSAFALSRRALEMCLHETFMDCPYYEQLAYIGDTRLQALAMMSISDDDRPVRKAIELFDVSRIPAGLTHSRYPSRVLQVIPTFSMIWVGMVYDYMAIRGDETFIRARLPGVRAVMDACIACVKDGLLRNPTGWNFVDWSAGFDGGEPKRGAEAPSGPIGPNAPVNFTFILALRWWMELEARVGEPETAARAKRWYESTLAAADRAFWNEVRGAWAENLAQERYSEHAQALAILAGADQPRASRAIELLANPQPDVAAATIYFTHYVFEALKLHGRAEAIEKRLDLWRGLADVGLKCLPESPEPTRSDCHAWGAHILYHLSK